VLTWVTMRKAPERARTLRYGAAGRRKGISMVLFHLCGALFSTSCDAHMSIGVWRLAVCSATSASETMMCLTSMISLDRSAQQSSYSYHIASWTSGEYRAEAFRPN